MRRAASGHYYYRIKSRFGLPIHKDSRPQHLQLTFAVSLAHLSIAPNCTRTAHTQRHRYTAIRLSEEGECGRRKKTRRLTAAGPSRVTRQSPCWQNAVSSETSELGWRTWLLHVSLLQSAYLPQLRSISGIKFTFNFELSLVQCTSNTFIHPYRLLLPNPVSSRVHRCSGAS